MRALIAQESARRGVPEPSAIEPAEVQRFCEQERDRLHPPAAVTVAAVVVADAALAERLLRQADGVTEADFARLVAAHSIDEASRRRGGTLAVITEHQQHAVERSILAVAWQLRRPGMVGLAEGADGRWYVVRASHVEWSPQPCQDVATRVRNLMVCERRSHAIDDLVRRLRSGAALTVDEAGLAQVATQASPP